MEAGENFWREGTMKFKRLTAAILGVVMLLGCFTGCKKDAGSKLAIELTMGSFNSAFMGADFKQAIGQTAWSEGDPEYTKLQQYMDQGYLKKTYGENYAEIFYTITISIRFHFNSEDLIINGDTAEVVAEYEICDWESAVNESTPNFAAAEHNLTHGMADIIKIPGKLEFIDTDTEGQGWQISKIDNLDELFRFVEVISAYDLEPEPTDPGPTENDYGFTAEDYKAAYIGYIEVLQENQEALDAFYMDFDREPCGLYDINTDGMPDLYFFKEVEWNEYSPAGTFCIYTYNRQSNTVELVVEVPQITFQAESGGDYVIYVSGYNFVIMYTDGEEGHFFDISDIYDAGFNLQTSLKRETYWEFDPVNNIDKFTYYFYENDAAVEGDHYKEVISGLAEESSIILTKCYYFLDTDPEYPLSATPVNANMICSDMINYISTLY